MRKKSQLFIFDLILAVIILIVTIGFVFSYYLDKVSNEDLYSLNLEILTGITQTELNSLNDDEIRDLFIANKVSNVKNTLAQQIAEFYYYGDLSEARNLTEVFVESSVSKNTGFLVEIFNDTTLNHGIILYENTVYDLNTFENSEISSQTTRNIYGFLNSTHYYGPYVIRIRLWK